MLSPKTSQPLELYVSRYQDIHSQGRTKLEPWVETPCLELGPMFYTQPVLAAYRGMQG